jgi:two-component system, OmpR family, phosphate regulon sensor histidine kinase PhoR
MSAAWITLLLAAAAALNGWWWWRGRRWREEGELARERAEDWKEQCAQARADNQAQLAALLDSMNEGVLVVDTASRVRLINRALQEDFQLKDEVIGRSLVEVFRVPELRTLVEQVGEAATEAEIHFKMPDGVKQTYHTHATIYRNSQNAPQGVILVFHDLTRLKRLENLRQEFVANVSHELRTPLSMIKGCVETLIDGAKNDPEARDRFLGIIERHADRLTFLIEDLLILSQLESGRVEFNFQHMELGPAVKRVLDDLAMKASKRKVTLENQIAPDLVVCADLNRLLQVFYNLVENAIKYGRAEGQVSVGARAEGDNELLIWVKDDGPGMPPEAVQRVFERFYRADKSRSREQGGTGLGLAIVKHIVQAHHGKVWVESQLGQGSTFFFTLPKNDLVRAAARV